MSLASVDDLLQDISTQLAARIRQDLSDPLIVGIHTGGAWLAKILHARLMREGLIATPLGTLDISFYRDDFTRIGLNPKVKPSELPATTEDRNVILVDDVLMTGRTIRAALDVLFEFGRPASVTLVSLVDLDARELPIRADIVGQTLHLQPNQRVKLTGPENLSLHIEKLPAKPNS